MRDPSEASASSANAGDAASTTTPDARVLEVWCTFLDRMATDAEAALAAAIAYQQLDSAARDVWVSSLEQDLKHIKAPRIAVYAPLLAVERDPQRRERLLRAVGAPQEETRPAAAARGLVGQTGGRSRIAIIVGPLYLDFVHVLACSFCPGECFEWVKHDPIVEEARAPRAGDYIAGVRLDAIPLRALVDDLAWTVVAHRRQGHELPDALSVFADLFGPVTPESSEPTRAK